MNEIITAIIKIKANVSLDEWRQRIIDLHQSSMSIKAGCHTNGIDTSSYYQYLRKIRESMLPCIHPHHGCAAVVERQNRHISRK